MIFDFRNPTVIEMDPAFSILSREDISTVDYLYMQHYEFKVVFTHDDGTVIVNRDALGYYTTEFMTDKDSAQLEAEWISWLQGVSELVVIEMLPVLGMDYLTRNIRQREANWDGNIVLSLMELSIRNVVRA